MPPGKSKYDFTAEYRAGQMGRDRSLDVCGELEGAADDGGRLPRIQVRDKQMDACACPGWRIIRFGAQAISPANSRMSRLSLG
jgi:hypothetical protein